MACSPGLLHSQAPTPVPVKPSVQTLTRQRTMHTPSKPVVGLFHCGVLYDCLPISVCFQRKIRLDAYMSCLYHVNTMTESVVELVLHSRRRLCCQTARLGLRTRSPSNRCSPSSIGCRLDLRTNLLLSKTRLLLSSSHRQRLAPPTRRLPSIRSRLSTQRACWGPAQFAAVRSFPSGECKSRPDLLRPWQPITRRPLLARSIAPTAKQHPSLMSLLTTSSNPLLPIPTVSPQSFAVATGRIEFAWPHGGNQGK